MTPRCAAVLLGLTLAAAAPVHAADASSSAREAFAAGERAFAANDAELALTHFRRAFLLEPHDAVRFNLAVCLEVLGRFREAAAEYDAAAVSTQLDAPARGRAREQATRVRLRLGVIAVDGSPPGAEVLVDGKAACTLPCRIEADPTAHEVVARADGRESAARVVVERGQVAALTLRVPTREVRRVPEAALEVAPVAERKLIGWPGWTGAIVAALGGGALAWFGVTAQGLHDRYLAAPSVELRSSGLLYRDLANAAIGVVAAGALLVLLDLVWFERR